MCRAALVLWIRPLRAMAAILGSDLETVTRACVEAAEGDVVSPANINGPGQIVIAGTAAAVKRAGLAGVSAVCLAECE